MTFCLTQKLSKKVKQFDLPRTTGYDLGSAWYGNLFRVGNVQYVLLTESLTLYSILLLGRGIVNAESLANAATHIIEERFRENGWIGILGKIISFDNNSATFLAAQDRSVLSSMNEIVRMIKWEIAERPDNLDSLMIWMNTLLLTKNGIMDNSESRVDQLVRSNRDQKP